MNQVIIISGPPGAGKTSVSLAICERFDRMLHIEVDTLRHWVVAGYRHPWAGDAQAAEQRLLATRNASAIARESVGMRYAAIIDDVVTADVVAQYREALAGLVTHEFSLDETPVAIDYAIRHPAEVMKAMIRLEGA